MNANEAEGRIGAAAAHENQERSGEEGVSEVEMCITGRD